MYDPRKGGLLVVPMTGRYSSEHGHLAGKAPVVLVVDHECNVGRPEIAMDRKDADVARS